MRKILILTKREYIAAVRTKSFIIALLIAPIFMGGSLIVFALFKDKVEVSDKNLVVIDHTGKVAESLISAAEFRNKNEIWDTVSGKQIKPAYHIQILEPNAENPVQQKMELSNQVRNKHIHAFMEIGPDIIHPGENPDMSRLKYYSENSLMDEIRGWFTLPVNEQIRKIRIEELNLENDSIQELFLWHNVEGLGLIKVDERTGIVEDAKQSSIVDAFLIPYVLVLLMFLMTMMTAVPLLSAVSEEKVERIAEVILGSASPFQFMAGKIIGSVGVSLTVGMVYIVGGVFTLSYLGYEHLVPMDVLPWFFIYMILNVIMIGAFMAALGSAANDIKDAQNMQFPAMLPILFPLFVMMPILKEPLSAFSTSISLVPIWTPMLMVMRQSTTVTIPLWQPILGLIGVLLFTILSVWLSGRLFRICILLQGKRPKISTLMSYAMKG